MSGEVQAICTSSDPNYPGCLKEPKELPEYWPEHTGVKLDPDTYVWREEGTLNKKNGHFLCTECYFKNGMPSSPRGWIAP